MGVTAADPGRSEAVPPLAAFNAQPAQATRAELLACCASPAWAERVAAGRPYPSVAAALHQSDAAVAAMTDADLAAALAGHPRIGERPAAGRPGQEQAGVRGADVLAALARANAAYEARFGHIYLVCAAGRTGSELLALLDARLSHSPETEWLVVRSELQKINRLRLGELLGGLLAGPA